jgi:hypothetical protein
MVTSVQPVFHGPANKLHMHLRRRPVSCQPHLALGTYCGCYTSGGKWKRIRNKETDGGLDRPRTNVRTCIAPNCRTVVLRVCIYKRRVVRLVYIHCIAIALHANRRSYRTIDDRWRSKVLLPCLQWRSSLSPWQHFLQVLHDGIYD